MPLTAPFHKFFFPLPVLFLWLPPFMCGLVIQWSFQK